MLRRKAGYPEVDELLLCTVTKIHHHSVFVNVDEYKRSGMIHISEISPGRIRNIRDYVEEGKVIVCKVLRIDKERGHIDLSLRRVNEGQRREKVDEIKQEQIVEKIIEFVAKKEKREIGQLYDEITEKVLEKYDSVYMFFEEVVSEEADLKDFVDAKIVNELHELILQRIKPKEIEIRGDFLVKSYASNGVEVVKEILAKALEKGNEKTTINYIGAGKYKTVIKAPEYKEAELVLKNMINNASKLAEKREADCEFIRED